MAQDNISVSLPGPKEQTKELLRAIESRDTIAFFALDIARNRAGLPEVTYSIAGGPEHVTPEVRERFTAALRGLAALMHEVFPAEG